MSDTAIVDSTWLPLRPMRFAPFSAGHLREHTFTANSTTVYRPNRALAKPLELACARGEGLRLQERCRLKRTGFRAGRSPAVVASPTPLVGYAARPPCRVR